ncbi:MAG: hypothetical protein HYU53_09995 [Acidobacteria bacterium]|nr:hypothetical protein [Acidobacteriota bacterium]
MNVYFSTVVRRAREGAGGEVVKVDWDRKRVLARAPVAAVNPTVRDPNPRGNTRGGRGILLDGDEVLVASYHSLLVFDRSLRLRRQVSHPLFVNLHEISWDGDGCIWATSTNIDAAVKVDRAGRMVHAWWPREDPVPAGRFRLTPLALAKDGDNRTAFVGVSANSHSHVHLNAATMWEGRPLMLFNRFGCVVRLDPTEVLIEDRALRGAHNLLVADGHILINNTVGRAVHVYDGNGRLVTRIDLTAFDVVRRVLRRHAFAQAGCWLARHGRPSRIFRPLFQRVATARPLFVRGLCATDRGTVLAGISPATILEIDWRRNTLVDVFSFSTDRHVCVHGLICEN